MQSLLLQDNNPVTTVDMVDTWHLFYCLIYELQTIALNYRLTLNSHSYL